MPAIVQSEFGEISSVLSQKYRNFTSNFSIYLGLFHHKKKFVSFSLVLPGKCFPFILEL